jgi:hypothetical protein
MVKYTKEALNQLYSDLILLDCKHMIFEESGPVKTSSLGRYENNYLNHALELFMIKKLDCKICDKIREELRRRGSEENE